MSCSSRRRGPRIQQASAVSLHPTRAEPQQAAAIPGPPGDYVLHATFRLRDVRLAHASPEGLPPSLPASGPSFTTDAPPDVRARDKAHIRAVRQRLIEEEQRRDEQAALHMTDEERAILERCFASVKTDFADLDGLSWSTHPPHIRPALGLGIRRAAPPDENTSVCPSSPWHSSKGPPQPSPRSQSYHGLALSVSRSQAATIRASLSPIQMRASPTVTQKSYLAACATKRRRVSAESYTSSW